MSRPFVVLIAGGTASGKTTLCRKLVEKTGALLITHDRYYCDIPHPRGFNFDHPDALDTARLEADVDALCSGVSTDLPVYDFATHSRTDQTERVDSGSLIVVEGILVLQSLRLVRAASLIVYVDTPDDIRLVRRIRRDISERGRTVDSVLDQYLGTVRPMHRAFVESTRDRARLVLDGTREPTQLLDELMDEMRRSGWVSEK